MCSTKPTSQSNTTQTSAPPSWVTSAYQSTIGQAQNQATTPYTPYTGQLVAPVNSQQTTGINTINSAAGIQNPYNTGASGLYGAGSSTITPSTVGANQIEQYESPYQSQVVNATEAELQNQNQQQSATLTGNTVASGAMGGDRAGVAQAALAGQQDLANNATIASLNNQNYEQALSEANTQQQTGLQAQEQTAANQLTAGAGLGALGNTAQTEALNLGNAQTNAGTLQQTTSQAGDTANYNQYLQQLAYPYQNLSWLSSIEGGLGSLAGGTTTGEQTTSSSSITPYIGAGLGLLSLLARGGRIPTKAGGGGMGGSVTPYSGSGDASITPLMPYSSSQQVAPGSGSYVPGAVQISGGHTMPTGSMGSSSQGQQSQLGSMQQTEQQVQQLGQGLGNLGTQFNSLGVASSGLSGLGGGDEVSGLMDSFALRRGGRTHYDDGGSVSDDSGSSGNMSVDPQDLVDESLMASTGSAFAKGGRMTLGHLGRRHFDDGGTVTPNDLLFDPNAMGLGAAAQQFSPNAVAPQNPVPVPSAVPSGSGLIQASNYDGAWPRGLRNNNPGNLVDNEWTQGLPGYSGSDGRFAVFATPQAGQSALDQNLQSYSNKGVTTPLQIASRWAPSGDGGNDPTSYASFIAKNVGVGINDPLDMSDPAVRSQVAGAITKFENGGNGLGGASLPSNTLAFDDSGNPISAGLGAISNALHLGSQPQANPSSPPSDMSNPITNAIGASPQGRSGLLGLDLSDSTRLGLLSAGLGIMGGTSRNPWVNIGQGGLEGIQAMQGASKNAAEVGLERAQTQGVMTDNQIKQMQVQMMLGGLEQMQKLNQQYEAGKGQAPNVGNNVTAPTVTAPTIAPTAASSTGAVPGGASVLPVAGNSAQPSVSADLNAGKQIDREWDPSYLAAAADAYSRMGPQWAQVANTYRQRLTQIGQTGRVMFADGTWGNVPGFVGSEAQKASATAAAAAPSVSPGGYSYFGGNPSLPGQAQQPANQGPTLAGTPPMLQVDPKTATVRTSIPAPPPGGGYPTPDVPAGAKVTGLGEGAREIQKADAAFENSAGQLPAVQQNIQRYQSMAQAFKLFQSGSVTDRLAAGAALAQSFGYPEMAQRILGGDPAAVQWIGKEAPNLVLQTLRAATPRFAQSEFNTLTSRGTPNPDLLPQTNHEFIAEGLGFEERTKAFVQDWQTAQTQGWESPSAFYAVWSERNPLNGFISSAERQIGNFKGMDLPPSTQWTPGTIYVAPQNLSPAYAAALAKRGVQPGQLFKFNGRDDPQPIQPIQPSQNFTSFLGQQ